MTAEIRIYVEGGGDQKETKARLRRGFGAFLRDLRDACRRRSIRWNVTACGGRDATFDAFDMAIRTHRTAFNVLLVDAEGPVDDGPFDHLPDRWTAQWKAGGVEERQCHLMVQILESWLIADGQQLAEYYGQGFHGKALPNETNVERVAKERVFAALEAATRGTKKGEYHKTRHAPDLLGRVRPSVVRSRAPYCDRLFETVRSEIGDS